MLATPMSRICLLLAALLCGGNGQTSNMFAAPPNSPLVEGPNEGQYVDTTTGIVYRVEDDSEVGHLSNMPGHENYIQIVQQQPFESESSLSFVDKSMSYDEQLQQQQQQNDDDDDGDDHASNYDFTLGPGYAEGCYDKQAAEICAGWRIDKHCETGNQYREYMWDTCARTCGFCEVGVTRMEGLVRGFVGKKWTTVRRAEHLYPVMRRKRLAQLAAKPPNRPETWASGLANLTDWRKVPWFQNVVVPNATNRTFRSDSVWFMSPRGPPYAALPPRPGFRGQYNLIEAEDIAMMRQLTAVNRELVLDAVDVALDGADKLRLYPSGFRPVPTETDLQWSRAEKDARILRSLKTAEATTRFLRRLEPYEVMAVLRVLEGDPVHQTKDPFFQIVNLLPASLAARTLPFLMLETEVERLRGFKKATEHNANQQGGTPDDPQEQQQAPKPTIPLVNAKTRYPRKVRLSQAWRISFGKSEWDFEFDERHCSLLYSILLPCLIVFLFVNRNANLKRCIKLMRCKDVGRTLRSGCWYLFFWPLYWRLVVGHCMVAMSWLGAVCWEWGCFLAGLFMVSSLGDKGDAEQSKLALDALRLAY
jgi:hypothetical protein